MMESKILGQDEQITKREKAQNMIQNALSDETSKYLNLFELKFKEILPLLEDLSKKNLKRILTKFLAHPILDEKFNLSLDKLENIVYNICIDIEVAKTNAMLSTMSKQDNDKNKE